MRPAALVSVLNEVVIHGRRTIVECGGGISTIYLARLLRQVGGQLTTIEHDETWARELARQVDEEGLTDHVTVVVAPLAPTELAFERAGARWYDAEVLGSVPSSSPVDLLVVDGPPGWSFELRHARYPAVPFFRAKLADDYAVALDDINRLGEQEVLGRWERELGITFERRFAEGRIAIGRSRQAFQL